MNYDLIIFDCDGVLVDSEPIANRIFLKTLASEGIFVPPKEFRSLFVGYSIKTCISRVKQYSGKSLTNNFAQKYYTILFEEFKRRLKPIPFIKKALQSISIPKCVASSGSHEKMQLTLGLTGLLQEFEDRIFSSSDVKRGKPFPDLFLHAAMKCKASRESCIVVEDSLPGIQAGVSAGMKVLGFIGNRNPQLKREFNKAGASVFSSMKDLPCLLDSNI